MTNLPTRTAFAFSSMPLKLPSTGVNLASVITFLAQGIRPRQWWEAEKAKRATRFAIIFWVLLLLTFLALTLLLKPQ